MAKRAPSPVAESSDVGPEYSSADSGVSQAKLYDKWHTEAYRGCKKPTPEQVMSRWGEFLAMAKKCECGQWHLEIGSKCAKCEKPKKRAN